MARERGHSTFKHMFGSNSNTIEVFFKIDCYGNLAPPTLATRTLEDTEVLGSSFDQIDVGQSGFYVALDRNYEKIFVMFGAGLKLIYGKKIGDYVEKAMCWNIEEYASTNPPEIPKDSWHKEYEE
ncbi:hypothetical protein HOY80DRAFT_1043022 [Tuber brumale]|nr:hypothetical protein HOY80DRAFT_1043022 [Tuber brumale]